MDFQFDTQKEYKLENDCVLLRPLTKNDCTNLQVFALQEPDIWQYSLVRPDSEENMKSYIDNAIQARETGKEYPFIVFDKRMQEYAGSTRFYDIQLSYQTLQLGFTWYGKKFQGSGLNKHCKYLLLEFAFETMGMERVEFRADANNVRSIAAMKSIGCVEEGIFRRHMPTYNSDIRRNSIVLSILKDEWNNGGKDRLRMKL